MDAKKQQPPKNSKRHIAWFTNITDLGRMLQCNTEGEKWSASHQTFSHTICVCWTITFLQRLPTNTPRLVWYVWELCLHASSLNVFPSVCLWTQHAHIQARWVNVLVPWRKNIDATDSWWKVYSSHNDLILMVGSPQTKKDISWR